MLPENHKNLPNLTSLRAIAALLVVVFHFEILLVMFVPPSQSMFFRKCYLMVDLFFIMSGFIIYHVYGQVFTGKLRATDVKRFLIARVARVYPLHLLSLAVIIPLVLLAHTPLKGIYAPAALPADILLLHSFGVNHSISWNVPSWSISGEFFAYLVFPFVALLLNRSKWFSVIILIIVIALYYTLAFHLSKPQRNGAIHNIDITYNYGYLRALAGFLSGLLVYRLYQYKRLRALFSSSVFLLVICLVTGAALHKGLNDLLFMPLFCLLVAGAAASDGVTGRVMASRPLQFLGNISYSIYLVQSVLFNLVVVSFHFTGIVYKGPFSLHLPTVPALCCCIAYLLVLIMLSWMSYKFIEKPARDWTKKKWLKNNAGVATAPYLLIINK